MAEEKVVPLKVEVNVATGEVTETPLTPEEMAQAEAAAAAAEQERLAMIAEQEQKEADKASAISKLTALGLTEDEALALVGQ